MNAEDFQTLNDLLVKVSTEDSARVDDKSKRVGYLNKLAEVIRSSILFCSDLDIARIIIENLQYTLMSNVKELRAGALRILRYILLSEGVFKILLENCIDLLIIRSVDISSQRDVERIQALRFIQQVCSHVLASHDVLSCAP
jgi:hypothetical protein